MAARFLLAALSIGAATVAVAEDLEWCGNARYFPSEYTCFDDSFMCPISFGLPNLPCNGGCFADQMYRCDDGALNLRGPQKTPFILKTASASAHVDGLVIRACGGYLAIGAGARECHGCQDADGVDCEEYGNQVVLLPNGEMAVDVEGGQEWYIRPSDGTLSYTRPEDTTTEGEGLGGEGVSIFEDGFFAPKSHPYWLSCLRTLPGGTPGTTRSYRLYSPSAPGVADLKCDQVKLVASSADKKDGAFQWH